MSRFFNATLDSIMKDVDEMKSALRTKIGKQMELYEEIHNSKSSAQRCFEVWQNTWAKQQAVSKEK